MRSFSYVRRIIFFLLNLLFYTISIIVCAQAQDRVEINCIEYRAAFDIGSETTKMKVAKIDKCLQKNLGIIYNKEVKVPYAENLVEHAFNEEMRTNGNF